MRISRKSGVLISSVVVAAALGTAGTATAAMGGDPMARPSDVPSAAPSVSPSGHVPAANPAAALAPVQGFSAVGKVVDTLQQAVKPHADAAQVKAAADEAKQGLDNLVRQSAETAARPGTQPQSTQLIAQSTAQVESALDAVVKADQSQDPTQILKTVHSAVQGLVNLVTSLLSGGGLPSANLAGLPKLPANGTGVAGPGA